MPPNSRESRHEMRKILTSCREGALPPNVALMQLAMAAEAETGFLSAVYAAIDDLDRKSNRLDELRRLAENSPDLWQLVRSVLLSVSDANNTSADMDVNISRWGAAFDRAAAVSGEASVALYSLGRADLLDAATHDVVEDMESHGVLGQRRALLDIGCGVGRFQVALAEKVGRILGLDISPGMIHAARQRCAGLANVSLSLYSGKHLHQIADSSFGAVLAIDVFPYIVAASSTLPARFFSEVARVLEPGGDFYLINYSYGRGAAADAREVARLSHDSDFKALRSGDRPFRNWDGQVFHLKRGPDLGLRRQGTKLPLREMGERCWFHLSS